MFCTNCGREAPHRGGDGTSVIEAGFTGFDCKTCGASMTFDSQAQGLLCAFCGSVDLKAQPAPTGRIQAHFFLPFVVHREAALETFEEWIGRGFFRPSGIKTAARVVSMRPVYLPFWSFRAKSHSYYAADSSRTPAFSRAGWCPVFGEMVNEHRDVLVPASSSLAANELAALEPFDFAPRHPYNRDSLKLHIVEDFGVSRRGARPRARAALMERERALAAERVPGQSRNVRVNPIFTDMRSDPVLLPIWINAYRYKDITYRFIINGQTGRLTGGAPFSIAKLAMLILAVALVAAAVLALAANF